MKKRLIIILILLLILAPFVVRGYFLYNKEQSAFEESVEQSVSQSVYQPASQQTEISFVGDILLDRGIQAKINVFGPNYPFQKVKGLLESSNVAMGNLENPAAVCGRAVSYKQYTFRAKPQNLKGLRWAGMNLVSIANNHILDYGREAMLETMQNLEKTQVACIGAGNSIQEAFMPYFLENNDEQIAFFAASRVIPNTSWYATEGRPGTAGAYNAEQLIQAINKVSKDSFVVVYLHWGDELKTIPNNTQRQLAKKLIDHGADLIIGTHPHVLEGFEYYKGKLIAYSLGNFIFNNSNSSTMILKVKINNKQATFAKVIPCIIKNYRPEPVLGKKQVIDFYNMMQARSFGVEIDKSGILSEENKDE
jgi:poly-gamma-glutamate synthesis protein (capsule biosynthesis protein)